MRHKLPPKWQALRPQQTRSFFPFCPLTQSSLGFVIRKFPHNGGKWKFPYVSGFVKKEPHPKRLLATAAAAYYLISLSSILYGCMWIHFVLEWKNEIGFFNEKAHHITCTYLVNSDIAAADAKLLRNVQHFVDDVYFAFNLHAHDCSMWYQHTFSTRHTAVLLLSSLFIGAFSA